MASFTTWHSTFGALGLSAALLATGGLSSGCVIISDSTTGDSESSTSDTTGSTSDATSSTSDTTGSTSDTTGSASDSDSTTAGTTEGTTAGTTDDTTTTGAETTTTDGTTEGTTEGTTTGGLDVPGFDPDDAGVQMCGDPFSQDPYDIIGLGPQIKGDMLFVEVAYSGGCAVPEHQFGLCWDSAFLESDPVQVNMAIGHESYDDPCEAYPMEQLQFDLTDLKTAWQDAYQQDSGTIIIHIGGWDKPIEYIF